MRQATAILITFLLSAAAGHAQSSATPRQPAATFKTDINLVEVHAVVTDDRGEFVPGLTKDDFEIFESGKPQTPTVFQIVDAPVATAAAIPDGLPVEPDVRETSARFDGRLYVLVLDDLHTSALRSQLVRRAARQFVERHLRDGDLAAVVHTSGRSDAGQELTPSRRLLLSAVEKFHGQKLPSITAERLAIHLSDRDLQRSMASTSGDGSGSTASTARPDDPRDAERGLNAQRSLGAIRNIARWMSDIPGRRKSLVLFSEGIEYDIYDVFTNRAASSIMADARDAIAAAQRSNVTIYAVDPRGLSQLGDESIAIASLSDDPNVDYGTTRGFQNELLMAQESLISLAEETGGFAVVRNNDLAGGLRRIERDTSRYYVLGYVSDGAAPGRFRKIDVKLRRPGLHLRARRGYVPSDLNAAARRDTGVKPGTPPALAAALGNAVPVGDVPLRVWAAPFRGPGKNASVAVAVEIDAAALKYENRDGRFIENLEMSIVAADVDGKIRGSDRQTMNLKLKPETHATITRRGGVRMLSRIELPPSRYQLRIGVHESTGGAIGTVPFDLDVPDYSKLPFAMSGLVVASSGAATFVTAKPDPVLKDVLPMPPVAVRSFSPFETLKVFTEVYERLASAPEVAIVLTVRRAGGGDAVFTTRDTRTARASAGLRTHGYTADVPLKDLPDGDYVLRVEATAGKDNQRALREVPFSVRTPAPLT